MKGKTLLSLAIALSMILAAIPAIPLATVKGQSASNVVSVVFDATGKSTYPNAPIGYPFNVSVDITNCTGADFYSIGIQWNPAEVSLYPYPGVYYQGWQGYNTSVSVIAGTFMQVFAGVGYAGNNTAGGSIASIAGYDASGSSKGNGVLFHMMFTCLAAGSSNISIISPNGATTYLSLSGASVIMTAVNGNVTQIAPPPHSPVAKIVTPTNGESFLVGSLVTLNGSTSLPGYDTLPAPANIPINWSQSYWTFVNSTGFYIILGEEVASFTCTSPGSVTITLTVVAPDTRTGSNPAYVDTDTSAAITIYQVAPSVGPKIDVYTERGGKGLLGAFPYPYGWSDSYAPQELVCVYANVTYNGAPVWYKSVEFVVYYAPTAPAPYGGTEMASYEAFTNESGIAKVCFRIPWEANTGESYFGNMSITGTVSIANDTTQPVQVNDTVKFYYGWLLEINSVTEKPFPVHRYPQTPDTMTVNVTICSNMIYKTLPAYLECTAADNCAVPFGQWTVQLTPIPAATSQKFTGTITVPEWAYVGTGKLYVDLLNSTAKGVPYCPEATIPLSIVYP